eukprot:CCRYP_017625-RA/>CCRYP_017625-RA protein AED:0.37 eAED:0.37 QI:0/0/0/1/0/0/3/0/206
MKIEDTVHMDRPSNATELCMFIGCVNYYHDMWPSHALVGHPGEKRLTELLQQRYHNSALCQHIEQLKCSDCQKYKISGRGYGLLPKREVQIAPWEEVTIDRIGPWEVKVNGIDNKTARYLREKFMECWLCRYPSPMCCVHNKGGEFIGSSFQLLLELFNIKDVCSTSKSPQSNAVCERIHQTVSNMLRTLVHADPPQNMTQAQDIM